MALTKQSYSVSESRNATENDVAIIESIPNNHKCNIDSILNNHKCNIDSTGTDAIVINWCKDNDIKCVVYKAEWQVHGRAAGPIRNRKLINNSVRLIAFPGPKSTGTYNAIRLAQSHHEIKPIVNLISN
jgi:hypothetical protein